MAIVSRFAGCLRRPCRVSRRRPIAVLLTVLFAAPFNISVAGEVQIQFGTFDLPPYAFYDGDGRDRGMLREINSEISDKAGLTHADRVMPLKRVHKELVKGDVACATFVPAPWSKSDLVQVAEITSELTSIIVPKKVWSFPILRICMASPWLFPGAATAAWQS